MTDEEAQALADVARRGEVVPWDRKGRCPDCDAPSDEHEHADWCRVTPADQL